MRLWISRVAEKIGQKSAENRAVSPLLGLVNYEIPDIDVNIYGDKQAYTRN